MWAAIGIAFLIALTAVGFIAGTIWFMIPAVLLAILLFLAVTGSLRSEQDRFARVEAGPRPDFERPEDDTSGAAEHKSPGYAHRGQERMRP